MPRSGCSTRTRARRAGSARSTTLAAAWLARFWAQELAEQTDDAALAAAFAPVAEQFAAKESRIDAELIAVQGSPVDIGGYYRPDAEKTAAVMRPSATLNEILASLA